MTRPDNSRLRDTYVDRIPKGAKRSELPVQVKFELGDHLETAKALGLTVPPTLLTR